MKKLLLTLLCLSLVTVLFSCNNAPNAETSGESVSSNIIEESTESEKGDGENTTVDSDSVNENPIESEKGDKGPVITVTKEEFIAALSITNYTVTIYLDVDGSYIEYGCSKATDVAYLQTLHEDMPPYVVKKDGAWYDVMEYDGAYVGVQQLSWKGTELYAIMFPSNDIDADMLYSNVTYLEDEGCYYGTVNGDGLDNSEVRFYFENGDLAKVFCKENEVVLIAEITDINNTAIDVPEFTIMG